VVLELELLPGLHAVCRLDAGAAVPTWAAGGDFTSVTRTPGELSVICASAAVPGGVSAERDWRVLRVAGPLDFELTGVAAALTAPLAAAGVSVLPVATYETDYVLVRETSLTVALSALAAAGHDVPGADSTQPPS
jgi:hypothetical protein